MDGLISGGVGLKSGGLKVGFYGIDFEVVINFEI